MDDLDTELSDAIQDWTSDAGLTAERRDRACLKAGRDGLEPCAVCGKGIKNLLKAVKQGGMVFGPDCAKKLRAARVLK